MKRALFILLLLSAPCLAARPLKQSTAVTVIVGPAVDFQDGVTPETGMTVTNITADLFKNDATEVSITLSASGGSNDMVHVAGGQYSLELTATDTNTLGYLRLNLTDPDVMAPIWEDFEVLPSNVYDSLYSTDKLQVHVTEYTAGVIDATAIGTGAIDADAIAADAIGASEIASAAIAADEIATDAIGADEIAANAIGASEIASAAIVAGTEATGFATPTNITAGTITTVTTVSNLAASAIGVGDIATGAITADAIATDAIGAAEIAAGAIAKGTEATGWNDLDAAGIRTAVGLAAANLDTQLTAIDDYVDTEVAAILDDTDDIGLAGAGLTAVPWNAAWDAEVESEATDALNTYDPPTNAEMEARTLLAASYFDPAADTVANVTTVATLTGHTAQTGDSFARLGAPAGASVSADIADIPTVSEFEARTLAAASYFDPAADTVANVTLVATTTTNTDMRGTDNAALAATALTNATWTDARAGYLDELAAANLPSDVDAILADTGVIGAAGAGLTAIPWNAAWDVEAQSEAQDAIVAYKLNLLMESSATLSADVHIDSVLGQLMDAGTAWTFSRSTDSLEAIGTGL